MEEVAKLCKEIPESGQMLAIKGIGLIETPSCFVYPNDSIIRRIKAKGNDLDIHLK